MPGYEVQAKVIEPGEIYEDENAKVTAFAVNHGDWQHAYGNRFEPPDRTIVISGDTAPTDAVVNACNGCDVLVHEVYCQAGLERGPANWQHYHLISHTSTKQLAVLATRAKPKLLVLYHLLFFGCTEEQLLAEIKADYKGNVALANDLDVF
jgi:ribonuclease BN (tRNA processing enzyme)